VYSKVKEFIEDWKYESEATLKIFKQLKDDSLNKKFNENVRSPGRLAWHIVTTLGGMVHRTGLNFDATPEDAPLPSAVKEICDEYKRVSEGMLNAVKKEWSDESLQEDVNLYGQKWKKGKVLSVLVNHQTHHRGQLTVIMRLAGLKVPGVYGPAREEWANMGMEAQE
jgi:uncharacterized damage-inducible protein DinB